MEIDKNYFLPHSSTNIDIHKYYQHEPRFREVKVYEIICLKS